MNPVMGVSISEEVVKITLRVRPGAAVSEVVGASDGVWQVKVAALPVKGQANRELVDFLSRRLGVARGRVVILRGNTARDKVVAINGLSREEIVVRLLPAR